MQKKAFKILSIDGGGIKGIYSARILQHFEEYYKCSLSDHFDLLCGTSTGGLIALALSLGQPASKLVDLYSTKGKEIFPKTWKYWGYTKQIILKGKYSSKALKNNLEELFGETTIGQSKNLLCIPAFCITNGTPRVFKHDHSELCTDNKLKYVDVALATSAAPTYFPVHPIEYGKQYIDGGVWANNPTMCGLLEALKYFVNKNESEFDRIEILSISSLSKSSATPIGSRCGKSFWHWKDSLTDTFMTGQSFFADFFISQISENFPIPIHYVRVPGADIGPNISHLIQMDIATDEALSQMQSMANDTGNVYEKKPEIKHFFETKKTIIK